MRWIDRGPAPGGITQLAIRFTQGWVDHHEARTGWRGERPRDSCWSDFRRILGERSGYLCWFCEGKCRQDGAAKWNNDEWKSTVDHFRPISKFPELAYEWSNWVFSCRACNNDQKKDNWSEESEYIDPAAADIAEGPEQYFDYDHYVDRGTIVPKCGIGSDARKRANRTIADFDLNNVVVRKRRLEAVSCFMKAWSRLVVALSDADRKKLDACLLELPAADWQVFIAYLPRLKPRLQRWAIDYFINKMPDAGARRSFLTHFGRIPGEGLCTKGDWIADDRPVEYIGSIGMAVEWSLRGRSSK